VLARALILGRHLFLEWPSPAALTNIKRMQIFFFSFLFVAMILSGYQPPKKKMITGVGIPLLISKKFGNFAMYFLNCKRGHSNFNFKNFLKILQCIRVFIKS
jgi:hypothetical protein